MRAGWYVNPHTRKQHYFITDAGLSVCRKQQMNTGLEKRNDPGMRCAFCVDWYQTNKTRGPRKDRPKRLVLLTKNDFTVRYFKAREVYRVRHPKSKVMAEAFTEERAFLNLVYSGTFQEWLHVQVERALDKARAPRGERQVQRIISPRALRVEIQRDQRWGSGEDSIPVFTTERTGG